MSREVDVKALVSHIVRGDGLDRCRICMGDTSEGQVHLDDTVMMDGDKPITLAELLESVTGVQMIDESLIPSGACAQCASAALAAQEFRAFVQTSEKMWSEATRNLATIPNSVTNPIKSIYALVEPTDLTIQTIKHFISDPKKILNTLNNNKTKNVIVKKCRGARAGPSCACGDCGKQFISPYYLNSHLRNSGQKEACIFCAAVLPRGKEMLQHMADAHGRHMRLCKQCPFMFPSAIDLKNHVKRAHKTGVYTCSDCGRTFPRKSSFESHSQMHTVRTCRVCGAQFTNRGCYREHRSQCEPDAKPLAQSLPRNRRSNIRDPATFTCDYCGKTYSSRQQLKNHIVWIHMNVRPFKCDWCAKCFYSQARLSEHSVVHTRVRNFACDICGAKLVSKMAAVYHRRRHTGERPYECEDCGEKFICASRRTEHAKRRHNKGKRLPCTKCSATFVRTHELKKHVERVHSNQELYGISVPEKGFNIKMEWQEN